MPCSEPTNLGTTRFTTLDSEDGYSEALRAYTLGGAQAERAEGVGMLRAGQAASFAVLSQDVLTVPAADLPATRSVLTLVDGVVIHEDTDSVR